MKIWKCVNRKYMPLKPHHYSLFSIFLASLMLIVPTELQNHFEQVKKITL